MKTLAIAHGANGSDDFEDVVQKLTNALFPYEQEKKKKEIQKAKELLEQEKGREIRIKEADY